VNTHLLEEPNVQAIFSLSTYRAIQISERVGKEHFENYLPWFVLKFLKPFIIRKNSQEKWYSLS
jgi:uncharacterized membrane protein YadS